MSDRSFRNPHINANLVDWEGVKGEKATNFLNDLWNPKGRLEGWYVEGSNEA
jgi:hypothetical protein